MFLFLFSFVHFFVASRLFDSNERRVIVKEIFFEKSSKSINKSFMIFSFNRSTVVILADRQVEEKSAVADDLKSSLNSH